MPMFTVRYHAGSYHGDRTVTAEDGEQAIAIVRALIRREMTMPMYSDSYRIVDEREQSSESESG